MLTIVGVAPGHASCSVSDKTATCTGDPGAISYTDGSVDTIDISDLTADLTGDTAIELTETGKKGSSHGDSGKSGADLSIEATTETWDITGTSNGVIIQSTGGSGHSGKDKNAVVGNETGGSGGSGGDGGALTGQITGTSTTISGGELALSWISQAGKGGDGGEGSSEAGEGKGGKGGKGGAGGTINLTLSATSSVSDGTGGIVLQSLAGKGGEGGEGGGEVGKGGEGGTGGDGGDITLIADDFSSSISTGGSQGYGIEASSLAAKGGKGGEGAGLGGEGGKGGHGGTGGTVTVTVDVKIDTSGDEAAGILVRSYGGDGGNGGSAGSIVSVGGADSAPGPASNVELTFEGSVTTSGSQAFGILAQSVGGFAGDAGVSGGLLAFGANGQSGGDAGDITLTLGNGSAMTIITTGDHATAIEMHSVGGGGGVGTLTAGAISVLGSSDSAGGDGGTIDFSFNRGESGGADIETSGYKARGVVGLSTGGGGGASGTAAGIVGIGGSGGSGGNGGTVKAYLGDMSVSTVGDHADAVHFASVGGGGGSAGASGGLVAMGASGGGGGTGGTVDVTGLEGAISTMGDYSDAILVQSVGGGGGKGTSALAVGVELSIAHGGSGGDGGSAGDVTYTDAAVATASMKTTGNHARGVAVQSVGGGGGSAGYATSISAGVVFDTSIGITSGGGSGADAGTVTAKIHGSTSTGGDHSIGVLAQSTGGGGGSVGNTVSVDAAIVSALDVGVALGGSGGDGGAGKTVTVEAYGDITTTGDEAKALFAQSAGGGGGHSSSVWSVSGTVGSDEVNISVDVALDGGGGGGGDAGEVDVTSSGTISTTGTNSDGIFLQSIGGGGGNAGTVAIVDVSWGSFDTNVGIGGSGGAGGDGSTVKLTSTSDVSTIGDSSSGIRAQSVGGSGGHGSNVMTYDSLASGSIDVTIGGAGGDAQNGDDVTVVSGGAITTQGDLSDGIFAQSVGGSGGSSGFIADYTAYESMSWNIEVSGNTGFGGESGAVSLTNFGSVVTGGAKSSALVAQSVAGGGGSAGVVFSGQALTTSSLVVEVGGNGGYGGSSGEAAVINSGILITSGDYAYGILAQSVAGAGGSAATLIEANASAVKGTNGYTAVGVGGSGGGGGVASDATVTNAASVTTGGFKAHGILAQSLGGAGGAGGSVVVATVEAGTNSSSDLDVTVGGSGGDGGSAADVMVENYGAVVTSGDLANGIFAQSIAGGGGAGGGSFSYIFTADSGVSGTGTGAIDVEVGGEGGNGGSQAGDVSVSNTTLIATSGGAANGIKAMSIGGIGGDGGTAANFIATYASSQSGGSSFSASVAVGGSGGKGHKSGKVTVDNQGIIATSEDTSVGIYASSVGGGGGAGGDASAITFGTTTTMSSTYKMSGSVSVSVGGSGGTGGDSEAVKVTNEGSIFTQGSASYGIFAHSVGGGGGTGGNGKFGINGWGSTASDIAQYIADANEIYNDYKSLSQIYKNVEVKIGGSGGAAGDGNEVHVTNSGSIHTTGDSGTAIYAQSGGGGGGVGGDGGGGLITSVDIGGLGSGGGKGGTIEISNTGTILTEGSGAMGIYAQSVGGGGGSAGDVEGSLVADLIDLSIGAASAVGADISGDGGNGGTITIDKTGDITTSGTYAHGVWAHSAGGGGGAAAIIGFTGITYGGVGGGADSGDGGAVSVTVDGDVSVTGDYAHGVFAQSASGKGGSDKAQDVTINVTGSVTAGGTQSRAILAQSHGTGSNGTIAITVAEGATIEGADDGYETIGLRDGSDNTIDNAGSILGPSASDSVYVIHTELSSGGSGGSLAITNTGTMTGSFDLNAHDANTLANQDGGTLNPGPTVDLGKNGTLTNAGTLSPGGSGTVATSTITGVVTQSDSGSFAADVDLSSTPDADLLELASEGASFAGSVAPNIVSYDASSGTTGSVTIITAENGTIDAASLSVTDSATVDYSLSGDGTDTVSLAYSIDASGGELTSGNPHAVGSYINELLALAAIEQQSYAFLGEGMVPLLNAGTAGELEPLLMELAAEEAVLGHQAIRNAALDFNSSLRSCPVFDASGSLDFNSEGECVWLRADGGTFKQNQTSNRVGYRSNAWDLGLGGQARIGDGFGDGLFLGLAGSYSGIDTSNDGFSGDADLWQIGSVLKQELGATTLSASLAGGYFDSEMSRSFPLLGRSAAAEGNTQGWLLSADLRADHQFDLRNNWYAKPIAALTLIQIWQDGFTESGARGAGLEVGSVDELSVVLSPHVEIGRQFDALRGYVRFGLSYFATGSDTDVAMRFNAPQAMSPWLTLTDETDDLYGHVTLGFDALLADNVTLSLTGDSVFSENTAGYGGSGKLRLSF